MFDCIPVFIALLKSNNEVLITLADGNNTLSSVACKAIAEQAKCNAEGIKQLEALYRKEGGLVEW